MFPNVRLILSSAEFLQFPVIARDSSTPQRSYFMKVSPISSALININ